MEQSSTSNSSSSFAFDPFAPTLFVSECVLVYLPPEAGDEVLRDAFEMLSGVGKGGEGGEEKTSGVGGGAEGAVIIYDPCKPETAFGIQMAANLRARGCELPGIGAAADPSAAAARLQRLGWEISGGCSSSPAAAADLGTVWDRLLPQRTRAHASRIEQLDELEEFNLIMEHYFLAVGVKRKKSGDGGALEGFGLEDLI